MEKDIENELIKRLESLGYTYCPNIKDRQSLEQNFKTRFEENNYVHLSDSEFNRLLISLVDRDVFVSSTKLREKQSFSRDDGTPLDFYLINDGKNWCKNSFQVVNQLRMNTANSNQRYDVIILINGLPLVQIELKDNGVNPRKAMQQIIDYKQDKGNGYLNSLLCFMQLFIVSNQSDTCYFTNNNPEHLTFDAKEQFLPIYKWADSDNRKVNNLDEFCDKFLSRSTLCEMISKYMVLVNTECKVLVMRPYQIYAVKAIMGCIGNTNHNGYIWHTTGSGKTLTSFKTATLMKENPDIYKCMFVVDRKDLDRQTREEFNKFQQGCVEENTNTYTLVQRMLSDEYSNKVIVTTIQKLSLALSDRKYTEALSDLKDERFVFIFDECHRSQFGKNHKAIKDFFPNNQMFGFTGTPIFEENSKFTQFNGEEGRYVITKDVFDQELHKYTITNAIDDRNVLKFHVDYYKEEDNVQLPDNDKAAIVNTIIKKHDMSTNSRRFNALFATSSINDAIEYYHTFKRQQDAKAEEDHNYHRLNITCLFTPPPSEISNENTKKDVEQLEEDLPQESQDNKTDTAQKKAALQEIIEDYNIQFVKGYKDGDEKAKKSGFSLEEFDVFQQDVQTRIKNQKFTNQTYPHDNKLDIVIVVDMLLTGFDSKYLNTLYVDKNLKHHSLIQAFSRTNRILNDTKPQGNILDFRGLRERVDEAVKLFSGESADIKRTVWLVEPKEEIIQSYKAAVNEVKALMQANDLNFSPSDIANLHGDKAKVDFINSFKKVQKLKTRLDQYTDLTDGEIQDVEALIPKDEFLSFKVAYIDTAKELKYNSGQTASNNSGTSSSVNISQLDFEFVLFASVDVDYDYIMSLVSNWTKTERNDYTIEQIINLIKSSAYMMDDDDIVEYIRSLSQSVNGMTVDELKEGFAKFKKERSDLQLATLAEKFSLQLDTLKAFTSDILDRLIFDSDRLTGLFEPLNLGWRDRAMKENEFMKEFAPLLRHMPDGKEISGLEPWEV